MATDDLQDRMTKQITQHSFFNGVSGECECGTWAVDRSYAMPWSDQWRRHVAESVVDFGVAPVLAERDAELEREHGSRQDWAAEAMRLDAELEQARHDRNLAQQYVTHLVYAATGRWAGAAIEPVAPQVEAAIKAIRALGEELDELGAELDALKAARMWRTAPISGVMHIVPDGRRESVCGLVASTTWQPAVDGNASCLECERWQPVTEATEQAPRCGEPGTNREFCDEPVPDGFCSEHGEVGPATHESCHCPVDAEPRRCAWGHCITCNACDCEVSEAPGGDAGPPVDTPATPTAPREQVDIDIRHYVITGETIVDNTEWASETFVMVRDVRSIIREWCKANGIPVVEDQAGGRQP